MKNHCLFWDCIKLVTNSIINNLIFDFNLTFLFLLKILVKWPQSFSEQYSYLINKIIKKFKNWTILLNKLLIDLNELKYLKLQQNVEYSLHKIMTRIVKPFSDLIFYFFRFEMPCGWNFLLFWLLSIFSHEKNEIWKQSQSNKINIPAWKLTFYNTQA